MVACPALASPTNWVRPPAAMATVAPRLTMFADPAVDWDEKYAKPPRPAGPAPGRFSICAEPPDASAGADPKNSVYPPNALATVLPWFVIVAEPAVLDP